MIKPDFQGFCEWAMDSFVFGNHCAEYDGVEIQEAAAGFGIIVPVKTEVPCGERCNCAPTCDAGEVVDCYRLTVQRKDQELSIKQRKLNRWLSIAENDPELAAKLIKSDMERNKK